MAISSCGKLAATKIEFYVGDVPEGTQITLQNARYTRLGYVSLSANEKTAFKARELKSVHVDAVGCFMKLVIHKNHINQFNLYNQVGVVAINIIGDEVNYFEVQDIQEEVNQKPSNRPDYISPLDDLAFDMYQDPEIAKKIRQLEQIKLDAVEAERYDYAKILKQAISDLQKIGEKLGKMDVEKRQAVENEDYDVAQEKKKAIEDMRKQVYEEVRIEELLAMQKSVTPVKRKSPVEQRSLTPQEVTGQSSPLLVRMETPVDLQEKPTEQPKSSPTVDNEDRPLPALKNKAANLTKPSRKTPTPPPSSNPPSSRTTRNKTTPAPVTDDAGSTSQSVTDPSEGDGEPGAMSEKDMREAGPAIEVFGLPLVSKAYSKSYSSRETAMRELQEYLMGINNKDDARTALRASLFLIQKAVDDKVFAVFTVGLQTFKHILTDFVVQHRLSRADVSHAVERVLPNLLHKCGDTALRNRDLAKEYIIEMSSFPEVQATHVVEQECMRPFKSNIPQRVAVGRVELLEALYKQHGLSDNGFTVATMMPFCIQCLQNTIGVVREYAERIIKDLYSDAGAPVKDYLPADDDKTRKNMIYRNLFEYFDKVDGKPSKADLKKQKMEADAKKQADIDALQNQLQQLKDMSSGKVPIREDVVDNNKTVTKKGKAPEKNLKIHEAVDDNISILNIDKTCIFCNVRDDSFTEEGLDLHYWKDCPMLKRCGHCKQVVEIAGLTEHMLTECDAKANFSKCSRCTEAIPNSEYDQHIYDKACNASKSTMAHCPLCHENIAAGDDNWKEHLMGKNSCRQNTRSQMSNGKLNTGKAIGDPKTKGKSRLPTSLAGKGKGAGTK